MIVRRASAAGDLPAPGREDPRGLQERHLLRADEADPRAGPPPRSRDDAGLPEAPERGHRRDGPHARHPPHRHRPLPGPEAERRAVRALPRGRAPGLRALGRSARLRRLGGVRAAGSRGVRAVARARDAVGARVARPRGAFAVRRRDRRAGRIGDAHRRRVRLVRASRDAVPRRARGWLARRDEHARRRRGGERQAGDHVRRPPSGARGPGRCRLRGVRRRRDRRVDGRAGRVVGLDRPRHGAARAHRGLRGRYDGRDA